MSRSTLAGAKAELFALLAAADGTPTFSASGVDAATVRVYDHEQPSYNTPISVSISFGGSDTDFWRFAIRVYAANARIDPKTGQDQLDLLIPAIEAKLVSNGGFDPNGWAGLEWVDDLDAFVVVCEVEVGREDVEV